MTRPPFHSDETAQGFPAPRPSYGQAVVLFDPETDTSPYAMRHAKQKPAGKRAKTPASPVHAALATPPGELGASAPAAATAEAARHTFRSSANVPSTTTAASPGPGAQAARAASPRNGRVPGRAALRMVPDDDPGVLRRYAEEQRRHDAGASAAAAPAAPAAASSPLPPEHRVPGTLSASPAARPPRAATAAHGFTGPIIPGRAPARPGTDTPQAPAGAAAPTGRVGSGAGAPGTARRDIPPTEGGQPFPAETAGRRPAAEPAPAPRGRRPVSPDAADAALDDGKPSARRRSDPAQADPTTADHVRAVRHAVDHERVWRHALVAVTTLASVFVTIIMLYFPAQDLYLALRQNERLSDELAQNTARNAQMQARVDSLQTAEGIQDEAHRAFGLAMPGEESITVQGLDEYQAPSSAIPAEVPRGSGTNTSSWATDLFDRVFGVTGFSTSTATAGSGVATVSEDTASGTSDATDASAQE